MKILKVALEMAKVTEGVFDPTIGNVVEEQGYNRLYLTGEQIESSSEESATYLDIILDDQAHTLYFK